MKKLSFDDWKKTINCSKIVLEKEEEIENICKDNSDDIFNRRGDIFCSLDAMIDICQKAKKKFAEVHDVMLSQIWDDYENCHFAFTYKRLETDEEFISRMQKMYQDYEDEYELESKNEKELLYKKELKKLNKKYGKL